MLKLYTEINDLNTIKRKYLVDLLKPLLPEKNFDKYDIKNVELILVTDKDEADYFVLPFSWNFYIDKNNYSGAMALIKKAVKYNKKILIWVTGDYYYSLPKDSHIIGLYLSPYLSKQDMSIISLPSIIKDPLHKLELGQINLRELKGVPSIGFCGQADTNKFITLLKIFKLASQNIGYHTNLFKWYSGPIIPPTYLRKIALDILDKRNDIHTQFIRRNRYQGGVAKNSKAFQKLRKEFYNNINSTDYTLCIRGTGNFSTRFYEALALGRIPIFVNTDCILPFSGIIDWKKHVVWIEQREISEIITKILDFHNGLTQDSFISLQIKNRKLWEEYFSFSGFIKNLTSHLIKRID